MKAAVFHKPGDIRYDTVEDPCIEQDTDGGYEPLMAGGESGPHHVWNSNNPSNRNKNIKNR
jgi:hypothetical protein